MTLVLISRHGIVHDGSCFDSARAVAKDKYRVVSAAQIHVYKLDRCSKCFGDRAAEWNALTGMRSLPTDGVRT